MGAEKGPGVTLTTIQFLEMLIGADGRQRSINKVRMMRYSVWYIVSSSSHTCFSVLEDSATRTFTVVTRSRDEPSGGKNSESFVILEVCLF